MPDDPKPAGQDAAAAAAAAQPQFPTDYSQF
jgi:hypothetical protein